MSLLQMSVAGGCIILATTVLRALAMHRLPKRTFLALWGVACARLLLPFSLPSPFGLFALVKRSAPAIRSEAAPAILRDTGAAAGAIRTYIRSDAAATAARHGAPAWIHV